MRLSARNLEPSVVVSPGTERPIRLRTGALTYMFTTAEAVDLATKLADAVGEINHSTRSSDV